MHPTAIDNCQHFFNAYGDALTGPDIKVIEIGAQDVNGSLRTCCPSRFSYCGVDFVEGKGVDVVLDDPYHLPFETASVDVVLTSSCLEHSEMFWLSFLEALRILKPHGLLYINAPSSGDFHRYPVDCWRFYPDAGPALVTWAKRNGMAPLLLESFTGEQNRYTFNDYVAIFVKDEREAHRYPNRILPGRGDLSNGLLAGSTEFINFQGMSEDVRKLAYIARIATGNVDLPDDKARLAMITRVIAGQTKVR